MYRKLQMAFVVVLVSLLSACGGGGGSGGGTTPTYSLGGFVTGLPSGLAFTLGDSSEVLNLNNSGNFTFLKQIADKSSYTVTVNSQPTGYTCSVLNATGTFNGANIANVAVSCVNNNPTFKVGGTVTGLPSGGSVTITNTSDSDALTISQNGSFTFPSLVANLAAYNVSVTGHSNNTLCSLANASGNVSGANVTNVTVTCVAQNTYTVGGTVNGLPSGGILVLSEGDAASTSLTLNAPGVFTFSPGLPDQATYHVTVTSSPSNYNCAVVATGASGTIAAANVTSVTVNCTPISVFTIGGTLSGLPTGTNVVLSDGNNHVLTVNTTGSFVFPVGLPDATSYSVTVTSQPNNNYACTVTNGSGTLSGANVTNVSITCLAQNTYSISGTIYGVPTSGALYLSDGNTGGALTVTQSGPFIFAQGLPTNTAYSVAVTGYPSNYSCGVTNGSGTVNAANVSNVIISCLSQDQIWFESSELNGGEYQIVDNLPAVSGTTPSSPTNYMYSFSSGGLAVSPVTGSQSETFTTSNLTTTLAVPTVAPVRVMTNGHFYDESSSSTNAGVITTNYSRVTTYVGSAIKIDYLATNGSTILESELRSGYFGTALSGLLSNAPAELSGTFDFYTPFNSNTSLLKSGATFNGGAAYYKYKKTLVADTYYLQDCVGSSQTVATLNPCPTTPTTNTFGTFFPFTTSGLDAVNGGTITYNAGDGASFTLQGLSVWVATAPRPSTLSATTSYRFFVVANGNIYTGFLEKAGVQIGAFQNNTIVQYFLRFNKAASDSFKAGVNF